MTKEITNRKALTKTEAFKRPDHYDFMDSSELKKTNFTGYRMNKISNECEIWLVGELRKRITTAELSFNPRAISDAVEEVFCLHSVELDK